VDLGLRGTPALVTGASRGLGRAIALALAAEGAKVAIGYRSEAQKAAATAADCLAAGASDALAVRGDMASEADVARIFDEAEARFGAIRALVNNAALCPRAATVATELATWNQAIAANLTGTFLACREFVRRIEGAGGPGRIVNVSSVSAFSGSTSGQAAYDASKGGIVSFSVSLARETASLGVTVNVLAPGLMMTDMAADKYRAAPEKYLPRIPLGRFAELDEVAAAAAFLCGRQAAYITGTVVNVSGGLLMR
jgi:3-oxoacyl-[acyl-carrier protein] reductase